MVDAVGPRRRDEDGADPYDRKPGADLTHIDFAEFPAAPWFLDDVSRAFAEPRAPYTPHEGDGDIREALRHRLGDFLGRPICADEIMLTTGVQNGIYLAARALIRPGDRVGVPDPDYLLMEEVAATVGAQVSRLRITWDGGAAQLAEAPRPEDAGGLRAVLLTSPNNPTGATWSAAALSELQQRLDPTGGYLVVDELYARVVFDGTLDHPASHVRSPHQVVTLIGPSKVESLSGLRIGVAIGPADVIAAMTTYLRIVTLRAPAYGQFALRQWFTDRDTEFMRQRTEQLRLLRDIAVGRLRSIDGMRVIPPAGGVYLFAAVNRLGVDGARLSDELRERARIWTTDGREFGPAGAGYVRICFAQRAARLVETISDIGKLLDQIQPG